MNDIRRSHQGCWLRRFPSSKPRPVDEVAGFRCRIHDPVLPAVEVEILILGAIKNPWFAVLQEVLGEPEESKAGSFRIGNHFRFSLKISGMNEIAQSR